MNPAETLRILEAAQGDPARLALATIDLILAERSEAERADVRTALLAAAVPHWFDERILAALLDERLRGRSAELVNSLRELRFVQAIPARGADALCVHQTSRQTLRAWCVATDAEKLHEISRRAAAWFAAAGGDPHLQIEALYHRFTFEPDVAADACWAVADRWMKAGRTESRLALANALDEIAGVQPHGLARGYALLESAATRLGRQDLSHILARVEEALVEAKNAGKDWLLAEVHSLRGHVRREQGRRGEALEDFDRAFTLAEGLNESAPETPRWRRELAILCYVRGSVLGELGNLDQALSAYRESHRRWAALVAEEPTNTDLLHGLAASHSYVGSGCYAQGVLPEALAEFQRYSAIMERLSASEPANGDWLWEFGVAQSWIGNVMNDLGDSIAALDAHRRYEKVLTELVVRDPENTGWRRDLAVAHSLVGYNLKRRGDHEEALRAYASGRALMEELVAADATNATWQRDLAQSRRDVADVLRARGEYPAALAEYEAALAITESLIVAEPANALWQNDLSVTHNQIALLRLDQKDVPGAVAAFRISLESIRRLAEMDATHAGWRVSLATSYNNLADTLRKVPDGRAEARGLVRQSLDILAQLASRHSLTAAGKSALDYAQSLSVDLASDATQPPDGAPAPRAER